MTFHFETAYDQAAVTAMAKTLRKTVRKKRSRRSHFFGWIIIALSLLLTLPADGQELTLSGKTIVTWLAAAAIFVTFLFEDSINGYFARKRMLPGLDKATVTFREDGYFSQTELGSSEFQYHNIMLLAETAEYFVFIFSLSHAQIYDKKSISGGTEEEFRRFITTVTGKEMQRV